MLKRGKMLNLNEEVPTCHWRKTLGAARKVARLGEIAGLKRDNSKGVPSFTIPPLDHILLLHFCEK
jgi:hypothetical protein